MTTYDYANVPTSETTIATIANDCTVIEFKVVNKSSNTGSCLITRTRGGVVSTILPDFTFPAKMPYRDLEGEKSFFKAGDIIKATASIANSFDIFITASE